MFNPMAVVRKLIWRLRVKNDFWGRCNTSPSMSSRLRATEVSDAQVLAEEFAIAPKLLSLETHGGYSFSYDDPALVTRNKAGQTASTPGDVVVNRLTRSCGIIQALLVLANKTNGEVFRVFKTPKGAHTNVFVGTSLDSGAVVWRLKGVSIELLIDGPTFYGKSAFERNDPVYKVRIHVRRNGIAYHHSLAHVRIDFNLQETTQSDGSTEVRLHCQVVDEVTRQPLRMEVMDLFQGVLKNAENIYVNPSKNKTYQKFLEEKYRV